MVASHDHYDYYSHYQEKEARLARTGPGERLPRWRTRGLSWPLVAALVLAGCAAPRTGPAGDEAEPPAVRVVATTSILGDVVAEVLGGDGELHVVMGAGVDPHAFQASAAQARRLREADLVVANGLALEEGLLDALEAAEEDGVEVLRVAEHVDPLPFALAADDDRTHEEDHGHADEEQDEDGHDHGPLDPHFWLDPVRMAEAVAHIGERIAAVAPEVAEGISERAAAYREEVLGVHAEIEEAFAGIPVERRVLVTDHDSLGYLAARYGFEVLGAITPGGTTLGGASAGELARLAALVEETGVPAIFVDTTAPGRLARAVSAEIEGGEVAVVTLHEGSLGEEGSGAETYLGLLRTNARRIADALGAGDEAG